MWDATGLLWLSRSTLVSLWFSCSVLPFLLPACIPFVCTIHLKAAVAHPHGVDTLALTNLSWPGTVRILGDMVIWSIIVLLVHYFKLSERKLERKFVTCKMYHAAVGTWWCLLFSAELTRLTQEYSTRTQLEVFCKDKTSKEDQIRRLWAFCKICHYLRKMYLWLVMQDSTHFVVLYLWKQSLYFCRCKLHTLWHLRATSI